MGEKVLDEKGFLEEINKIMVNNKMSYESVYEMIQVGFLTINTKMGIDRSIAKIFEVKPETPSEE